ncbi:MAG: alpha-amylase [Elusimicrobia bacterium CG_4_10_14_0_2_um_filter_56_8]|nr:MAG: alpha-amylase [Elusimicrobia bacterium CG_4_10_14_0_2_um_filter_56_8]
MPIVSGFFRVFFAISILTLPGLSFLSAGPAADTLKAEAEPFEFVIPEPSSVRLENSPLVTPARAEWFRASSLYSDKTFKPAKQNRVDTVASKLIMLQGFHWYADDYWYHPAKGWWGVLADKAGEVGRAGFDLVWFPPVSNGSYYPNQWYNADSQWGKKEDLFRAVKNMHSSGVKVVADVVINHRNGTRDWADFTTPDWPSSVIVRNDEWQGSPKSKYDDEGQGEHGCRDLDHRDALVQQDTKIFLRWLKNTVGFDGWRYDMVKGYPAHYVQLYNEASSPVFSVGEFYDTNRQLLADWVSATDSNPGQVNASTAFDFTTRYALIGAVENERYEMLNDNGRPSGLIGWWPAKSVTYVESHDTSPRDPNFLKNASAEYKTQRLMGYAYILTHPGIPCVFWPHFFDWGRAYRSSLQKLIDIRKRAGITSTSRMAIMQATNELYAAVIDGENQRVVLKLGKNWGWNPGEGWTLAASGERYAVWTQNLP